MENEKTNNLSTLPDDDIALDIQDLTVHYELEDETVEAVNGISLRLMKGQSMGLVGETGAGKTSTCLSVLNLIQSPPGVIKSGSVKVCGKDVLKMTPKQLEEIRGKDVSMIFQDPMTALNPVMTVGDQIAESLRYHEDLNGKELVQRSIEMLELVGIPGVRSVEYPHQFSGGMKQRVVIAIALACSPKLLMADEPTSALDVTIQAQVLDTIQELRDRMKMSLLLVTHDLGVVAKICDTVAIMYAGKIVEYGTLEEVFNHTKHPYTQGLFNSLPDIKHREEKLKPIPGLMPDPTALPKGCAFEPRCSFATEACKEECTLHSFGGTHIALCNRYEEKDFDIHFSRG